jgi:Sec-independent protein translocase protein TatA
MLVGLFYFGLLAMAIILWAIVALVIVIRADKKDLPAIARALAAWWKRFR